jgi:tetratricopeptide (TPR) repeat protein
MSNRWQFAVIFLFQIASSSVLQCAAETAEERREIGEANALSDKQAKIKHLDNYLLTHPNSARVVGFRAEVYNVLGKSKETIRDATRYFELNKERELPVIRKVRAHAYMKLGELSKALYDLDAAKRLDAKDGDTALMRALTLEQLGRREEALAEYSQAIRLKCDRAYLNKGCLELRMNKQEAGIADCVSYVRTSKDVDAQECIVGTVGKLGKQDLLALYDGLIAAKVAKQFVYVNRAHLVFSLGDLSRALTEFEYCEQTFGLDFAETRLHIYCRLRQYDQAFDLVNNLISKSPKQLSLYMTRADCYLNVQNYDLALADLNRADALVTKNMDVLRKRAECAFRLGKYEQARVDFAKGNSSGATVNSLTFEGLNFKALKKYDDGVRCFSQALKLKPLASNLYTGRADCYFHMNDYVHCDRDLSDAIALDVKNPSFYFARGTCRFAAGDTEAAIKDFTASLPEKNLRNVVYVARAKAYAKLGQNDLASKDLRAAAALNKALEVDLFKQ